MFRLRYPCGSRATVKESLRLCTNIVGGCRRTSRSTPDRFTPNHRHPTRAPHGRSSPTVASSKRGHGNQWREWKGLQNEKPTAQGEAQGKEGRAKGSIRASRPLATPLSPKTELSCFASRKTGRLRNRLRCLSRHLTMSSTYLNSWI